MSLLPLQNNRSSDDSKREELRPVAVAEAEMRLEENTGFTGRQCDRVECSWKG